MHWQSCLERAVQRDGGACKDLPPHLHGQQHHTLQGHAWALQGWDHSGDGACCHVIWHSSCYSALCWSDEMDIQVIRNLYLTSQHRQCDSYCEMIKPRTKVFCQNIKIKISGSDSRKSGEASKDVSYSPTKMESLRAKLKTTPHLKVTTVTI